jgi:hypothetical protein
MFCHHGWLQKKTADDFALDSAGQEYPGGNPSDIGLPTLIRQTDGYTGGQTQYPGSLPVSNREIKQAPALQP